MVPERWDEIKDRLQAALELEPEQRDAYVNQVAATNPELRHELESLIASHEQAGTDFLNTSAAQAVALDNSGGRAVSVGRRIGPYQIIEEIGTGGMGEVYRAFRADDQYHKQVAIKLVRGGQDSAFVLNRFRNERQILAILDHPNIARLLDGGTTEEGVPYFAMELIEGNPIDEYCANHKLSISERLKLFLLVCSAVQYAHQRLIIHRDLKPGNILVTTESTPKLLDFGIAKLLDTDAIDGRFEPTLTMFRVLTPGYASPEQVKGEPITTASDVYVFYLVVMEFASAVIVALGCGLTLAIVGIGVGIEGDFALRRLPVFLWPRLALLLSKETEIELPGVGTSAIPLFASVPFSQLCTVEVRSNCRYPIELTETALNSFVPSAGALFQVIVPSDHVPFT
jgi:serine/threonine protein kinase